MKRGSRPLGGSRMNGMRGPSSWRGPTMHHSIRRPGPLAARWSSGRTTCRNVHEYEIARTGPVDRSIREQWFGRGTGTRRTPKARRRRSTATTPPPKVSPTAPPGSRQQSPSGTSADGLHCLTTAWGWDTRGCCRGATHRVGRPRRRRDSIRGLAPGGGELPVDHCPDLDPPAGLGALRRTSALLH